MKRFFFPFLSVAILYSTALYSQPEYPPCLDELISKIAGEHRKNPCDGSDKLLRIEQYSYKDTILYKLVFERKNFCPDYINTTVFYDTSCQAKIQVHDGGLKYRHEILPSWIDEKEIKFIKSIDWEPEKKALKKPVHKPA